MGPGSGAARVLHGGLWAIGFNSGPSVSSRNPQEPHLTSSSSGFRCLREAIPGREPALALSSLTLSERFVASGGAIDETARPLRANHHWDTRPWCSAVAAIMSQAPKTCTCTRIFCRPPRLHASEL